MNLLQDFFHTVYNVPELIRFVGQYGIPLIIFAETGLLAGFFLPGDSLLITAGLFAARGDLSLPLLTRPAIKSESAPEKRSTADGTRCSSAASICR